MELEPQVEVRLQVDLVARSARPLHLLLHRLQRPIVEPLDEQPRREALQHDPHVQHVVQVGGAQLADPGPAVGQGRDQPLGLQDADGLPQRRAAHAQQRDQLALPDALARLQPAGDDGVAERVDHPVSNQTGVGESDS